MISSGFITTKTIKKRSFYHQWKPSKTFLGKMVKNDFSMSLLVKETHNDWKSPKMSETSMIYQIFEFGHHGTLRGDFETLWSCWAMFGICEILDQQRRVSEVMSVLRPFVVLKGREEGKRDNKLVLAWNPRRMFVVELKDDKGEGNGGKSCLVRCTDDPH